MDFQELYELYSNVVSSKDEGKIDEFKNKYPKFYNEMELLKWK